MKYTCSLCGGKLKDGICTECGMNNQKSDEMYRDCLNRSKYDHASGLSEPVEIRSCFHGVYESCSYRAGGKTI